jgi:hypothetical protein
MHDGGGRARSSPIKPRVLGPYSSSYSFSKASGWNVIMINWGNIYSIPV